MVTEPSSIVTMKEYYGDRLYVEDKASLLAELMEGNDRSAIITMAALCDYSLEFRIGDALPGLQNATKKEFDDAFRHDGALGTFSARIGMAFYMGLIDGTTQKQLTDMRHMRNAVAHTKRRVTFTDVQLQNVARRILYPTGLYKLMNDTADGFLRSFLAEGMLIWGTIRNGREKAVETIRASFAEAGKQSPI